MGYFSNGTEGMAYMGEFCVHCRNYRDLRDGRDFGCPLWDAHLAYQGKSAGHQAVLDSLMPRSSDKASNLECLMYLPTPKRVKRTR